MQLRLAWITPLVLAFMASAGGASASADTTIANVEVYGSSGPGVPQLIKLSTLQGDTHCAPYAQPSIPENGATGVQTIQLGADAWSVETVLSCTGAVDLGQNASVVVTGADGTAEAGPYSVLSGKGLDSAVISYTPGNIGPVYGRSWNSQADDDDQVDDVPEAANGIGLAVYNAGPTLNVSISPQNDTITAGAAVTFNASAPGAQKYSWTFGGGAPASTQAAPAETFNTAGTYDVSVVVTDGQAALGTADTTITVDPASGAQPTSTGPNPQAGNGTTGGTSPTGPVKGGGGTPGTKPGSSHKGSTSPRALGAKKPSSGHAKSGSGKAASIKRGAAGTAAGSSTTGSSATSGQGAGHAATTAPPTQTTATTPARTPPPVHQPPSRHHATAPAPPPAQGRIVRGRLISDVVVLPADQSPLVAAAEPAVATPPRVRPGVRGSVFPGLGAALAIVLLLALGAGRELRGGRAAALRAGA